MARQKGRGAREQNRADRRNEYATLVAPHFKGLVVPESPADRIILFGDELVDLALQLAPKIPDGQLVLITSEYDRWQAASEALAKFANATVLQELAELRDPDGFPTEPWSLAVMLVPFQLGAKTVLDLMRDLFSWLRAGSPIYLGGSRMHEWQVTSERFSAMAGPLTVLYNGDPVKIAKGMARGGSLINPEIIL
ncbi:hypothetical protein [Herpetosiphon sp. NSE202]|uniref:hypothetical protein n=1 Tax=Herpetosiphon sp. NSE202 TaxID=3351349 RepID=UPI00364427CE